MFEVFMCVMCVIIELIFFCLFKYGMFIWKVFDDVFGVYLVLLMYKVL